MLKELKEMEQLYCLEIPRGVRLELLFSRWGGTKALTVQDLNRKQLNFLELFDYTNLLDKLEFFGLESIKLFGVINGPCLQFTCFDATLNGDYISVPLAHEMSKFLKFDFVKYSITTPKEAEFETGVILKPIHECVDEDGKRIIEEVKG